VGKGSTAMPANHAPAASAHGRKTEARPTEMFLLYIAAMQSLVPCAADAIAPPPPPAEHAADAAAPPAAAPPAATAPAAIERERRTPEPRERCTPGPAVQHPGEPARVSSEIHYETSMEPAHGELSMFDDQELAASEVEASRTGTASNTTSEMRFDVASDMDKYGVEATEFDSDGDPYDLRSMSIDDPLLFPFYDENWQSRFVGRGMCMCLRVDRDCILCWFFVLFFCVGCVACIPAALGARTVSGVCGVI